MVIYLLVLVSVLYLLAYNLYGKYIANLFQLNNQNPTPAKRFYDNIDYVPTRKIILFGHHFSSIAGAGPIVGPILGGILFGWGAPLLWITFGCIFIGAVHDFATLVASIRHDGKSISELAQKYIGKTAYKAFLIFTWLSLIYVITVFTDITATTFEQNGTVTSVSLIYILLAIAFGPLSRTSKKWFIPIAITFIALTFVSLYISSFIPISIPGFVLGSVKKSWALLLLIYAFTASVLPVWLLLQPRDFLSSFLLYSFVVVGSIGVIIGGFSIKYPVFTSFNAQGQPLFPMLFVTIACGAISGFHSLVASGTSSKQLKEEKDAQFIGYGAMLVEGLVAFLALATVMIFSKGEIDAKGGGIDVFGLGMSKFVSAFGISPTIGKTYGLLILSAFVLTTLDTATRIARYILQELFHWDTKRTRLHATAITLVLPIILTLIDIKDKSGNIIPAYKAIWPVFGTSNQLLAALVLLTLTVWIRKINKNQIITLIPSCFMFIVTLTALYKLVLIYGLNIVGIIAAILFVVAIYLILASIGSILRAKRA